MKMATNKIIEIWFSTAASTAAEQRKAVEKIGQMRTNARTKGAATVGDGQKQATAKTAL